MADKNMEQVMEKAQVLIEALPYIQRFNRKIIVENGCKGRGMEGDKNYHLVIFICHVCFCLIRIWNMKTYVVSLFFRAICFYDNAVIPFINDIFVLQ